MKKPLKLMDKTGSNNTLTQNQYNNGYYSFDTLPNI